MANAPLVDPMDETIWRLDATAQADLIRSGALSAVEVVRAALDRAEELEVLNTATVLLGDRALARASEASGPFAGVPILLKDAGQELAGTPMWMGASVLKAAGYTSTETTQLAAELEARGFVIIGKAAVSELMTGITTEPPTGPPTRNPWSRDRTAGGSSGGSAAAVAAGIVPLAHGSDSTGSLRFPASCCGVLTLKPSAGRISSRLPGGIPNPSSSHTDFMLARSARDLRGTFTSLALPPTVETFPPQRIGVLDAMPFGLTVDPAIDQALADVAAELGEIGCHVESMSSTFLEDYGTVLHAAIPTIVDAHRAAVVGWIEAQIDRAVTDGDLSPSIIEAADRGRSLEPRAIAETRTALSDAGRVAAGWSTTVDAILLPILDVVPWRIGTPSPSNGLGGLMCSLANFSGQPAVAIPTLQQGLPIGVQLLGSIGQDEALLDLLAKLRPVAPACPYLPRPI